MPDPFEQQTAEMVTIERQRPRRRPPGWLSHVRFIIVCLAIFFGTRTVAPTVAIEGESMSPTLHTGERVILNGVYRLRSPHRGDIVVFHPPYESDTPYIKRVIGLPGEQVEIHDGTVFVDGQPLDEPYLHGVTTSCRAHCSITVPAGAVFVMGDNRPNSSDSRDFGPIRTGEIIGEAVFSVWPLSSVSHLD